MINLGAFLQEQGKLDEAAVPLREAVSIGTKVLGAAHPTTKAAVGWLEMCV